jgi:predicted DNA-binding transcriptional regulator YafY
MNRIDRLFGIMTLLQSRKFTPAEKIADKFHISIRTVYRDVKALNETGVPVNFEPNKGYYIINGYFIPPVSFNMDETNALLLMESLALGFSDKSIQQNYAAALAKIKAVLKPQQKDQLEVLNQNIKMQVPPCFVINSEFLAGIQRSISSKMILEMHYKNKNDLSGRREVEPIGLVFYALNWHMIAWCHKRNEYRDFRVSRIENLRETATPFTRTEHIQLSEYMMQVPVEY